MNSNAIYEVKAEAFRLMTGHMAPGKDPSPESYPDTFERRSAAWDKWHAEHNEIIVAMVRALHRIVPDGD